MNEFKVSIRRQKTNIAISCSNLCLFLQKKLGFATYFTGKYYLLTFSMLFFWGMTN